MDDNLDVYELASANGETVSWTADRLMEGWYLSVTSFIGNESGKTLDFTLTVTEPVKPVLDECAGEMYVTVTSLTGELHAVIVEYDADGNIVAENTEDVADGMTAKAPATDDNTWLRKVAEENEAYRIDAPATTGNYKIVRAKSVLDGVHSEELIFGVNSEGGAVSGIAGISADDTDAPVEYFNLQGVRVNADRPGLYIRRQGSKAEKVAIR